MRCVVTFHAGAREHGLHFDLQAFRGLEQRGYTGVVPLYDGLRDLRVSAITHALEAGMAGHRRLQQSQNAPVEPPLAAAAIDAIINELGLAETRDLLMKAISAAAVRREDPEEAAAAEGKAPTSP